ncbi:Angiomotin [Bienertia sinuspersici]
MNNVTGDAIRLHFFPFSLRDRVREWLRDEGTSSFGTWEKLAKAFLVKFLGQDKTAKLSNELATFRHICDDSLYEAWSAVAKIVPSLWDSRMDVDTYFL